MIGRNELCPCGSGKKYKKCCLAKDEAKEIAKNRILYATNQYQNVLKNIEEFSAQDEYKETRKKCELDFHIDGYQIQSLINTYYLCDYKYDKQTSIMMDYFNSKKADLNDLECSIVENTLKSYVSIYQVKEKDINKIQLRDILLNENVYVEDINLFENFALGDYVLARIVVIANTKILLDETFKINENQRDKIKNEFEKRYKNSKKRYKDKKDCLKNNSRFMYKNIVEINKLELEPIEDKKEQISDILSEQEEACQEEAILKEEVCFTEVVEANPVKKVCEARIASPSKKKKVNKRLEEKLKERLNKSRKEKNMQPTDIEIISKIDSIPVSKKESISSKINNNIVAKLDEKKINKKSKKSRKNRIKINNLERKSELSNSQDMEKLKNCGVYNLLMSKVELEYREKCVNIWKKFIEKYESYNGSEGGWVSALEYYVRKEEDETITQEQISKKYGVSPTTLGRRYKKLQADKTLSNL